MLHKLQTIRHSIGFQQSVVSIGGSVIAAGLSAIATLVVTRKLGPEEFGIFSVGFALVQILVRLTDFGMTAVVQRFASKETNHTTINRIFSYTTRVRLITWIALSVLGILVGESLSNFLHFGHPTIITSAFIIAGATYFYEHFQSMLQAIHKFSESAIVNISQSLFKTILAALLFVYSSVSTFSVFIGYMAAPIIPFIFFKQLFPKWVTLDLKDDFSAEKKAVSQFALHSAVGFISAGIIENIDILFVQKYLTTYEAGLLGGANKIALLFSVIAYSLGNVLNARVSRYQSKTDIRAYLQKAWLILGGAVVGFLAFIPFSRFILLSTIGEAYLPALPLLLILVASSFLSIAVIPFIALFFSFNKPWYFSVAGAVQLLIILGGNLIYVPVLGLEAAAWTRLTARACLLLLTIGIAWWVYTREYEKK